MHYPTKNIFYLNILIFRHLKFAARIRTKNFFIDPDQAKTLRTGSGSAILLYSVLYMYQIYLYLYGRLPVIYIRSPLASLQYCARNIYLELKARPLQSHSLQPFYSQTKPSLSWSNGLENIKFIFPWVEFKNDLFRNRDK